MRSSLGGLQDRGKLRVRGCEQAGNLLGEGRVRRDPRKLVLPEVEITAGQPVELAGIRGATLFIRGHAPTIAHRYANVPFAGAARLVALRYKR